MGQLPFVAPLMASPLPWVILGGAFAGAALSRATRRTRHKADPERASARKWVFACLYLSVAVVLGLLAVFVPGPSRILNAGYAWAAAIAAAVVFAALRFRKAAGIPVVSPCRGAGCRPWAVPAERACAFTGETEIASVRVISVEPASMRLELVPRGGAALLSMKGTSFAPIVRVVIFDDLAGLPRRADLVPVRGDDLVRRRTSASRTPTSGSRGLPEFPSGCGSCSRSTRRRSPA